MSLTPSGCSFALSAGMKNVAGILYCSSRRNTRGSPARAPYSPCAISPGETCPSLSEGVSLSKSKDSPTATRELFGHCFGVRSRPARTCLTISKTLLSGHFHDGSCCWFCVAPINITTSGERPSRSDALAKDFSDLITHSSGNQPRRNEEDEDSFCFFFVLFVSSWLILIVSWSRLLGHERLLRCSNRTRMTRIRRIIAEKTAKARRHSAESETSAFYTTVRRRQKPSIFD